jgi:hypothetical protein
MAMFMIYLNVKFHIYHYQTESELIFSSHGYMLFHIVSLPSPKDLNKSCIAFENYYHSRPKTVASIIPVSQFRVSATLLLTVRI